MPWDSTAKILEKAKVCTPAAQGSELSACSPHCPEDPQLHCLIVAVAKAALEHCIPHQLLTVGEHRVQHGTSPCWLLSHLGKKVVIGTFKEPPGCLCIAMLSFQQLSGWLKFPMRIRACECEDTLTVCRVLHPRHPHN